MSECVECPICFEELDTESKEGSEGSKDVIEICGNGCTFCQDCVLQMFEFSIKVLFEGDIFSSFVETWYFYGRMQQRSMMNHLILFRLLHILNLPYVWFVD